MIRLHNPVKNKVGTTRKLHPHPDPSHTGISTPEPFGMFYGEDIGIEDCTGGQIKCGHMVYKREESQGCAIESTGIVMYIKGEARFGIVIAIDHIESIYQSLDSNTIFKIK